MQRWGVHSPKMGHAAILKQCGLRLSIFKNLLAISALAKTVASFSTKW